MRDHTFTKRSLALPALLALTLALPACMEEPELADTATWQGDVTPSLADDRCDDGSGQTHTFLIRVLKSARALPGDVSQGFDLDDHITSPANATEGGCGQMDFATPGGRPGIDNQFARLLPTIEAIGGSAFENLIQAAINEGDLLILVELEDVDDLQNDGCVNVNLTYATGAPYVGRDELIEPWQTFDIDTSRPFSRAEGVAIKDGGLDAGPLQLDIPFAVFDFIFPVTVLDMRLHIDLDDAQTGRGTLGGAITIQNMLDIANGVEGGEQFPELIMLVGHTLADLMPDDQGQCQALSIVMTFDLVGAFVYPDSERFEF